MVRLLITLFLFSSISFAQNAQDNNLFFMGQSFEQAGNFEKAREVFEDLYKRNKGNYQYFDALNRVYLQLKEYELSIALIDERLKVNSSDVNLFGVLGKTYHMSGDETKAFGIWDSALEKAEGNPAIYKMVANFAIDRREFRKAVEILQKGKEITEEDEIFSYDLANIYALLMQYENSAEEYCSILLKKPAQYSLVEAKILSYINKPEALVQTIRVVEDHEKNAAINGLLGRLYIEAEEFEKAFYIYVDLADKGEGSGVELFRFAEFAYAENEFIFASRAFNEVIKEYPASPYIPNAKLGYAKTLEQGLIKENVTSNNWNSYAPSNVKNPDKFNEVITAYNELIQLYPSSEVGLESNLRIGIIKSHYQNKQQEAEDYFYKIISNAPNSRFAVEAYSEIGEMYLINGNLANAYESFNKIVQNERALEDQRKIAEYRLALINFYLGDIEKSKQILTGLTQNLKDYAANDAIELSLILNTAMNDSSNLIIFSEAEFLKVQRKFEAAAEKYRRIYTSNGGFLLQHVAKFKEAEMELAMNNVEKAAGLFEKIAEEKEKNIYADKALYLLGQIYKEAFNNPAKAVELFEDLLLKFPNSLYIDKAREEILIIRKNLS